MSGVSAPRRLLAAWSARQLPETGTAWLDEQLDRLSGEVRDRDLYVALGLAPRKLGKHDLTLSEADLAQAAEARPGWDPRGWSVDQAARILILLQGGGAGEAFASRFTQLCRTADVAEQVAFYRGLPLYPDAARLEAQAAEGTRTNMRAVFEAVTHRNPFPREQFAENRWNHMVLKALFVGSTLHPIQGLEERANPSLARMLSRLCARALGRGPAGQSRALALRRSLRRGRGDRRSAARAGDRQHDRAPGGGAGPARLPRYEGQGAARLRPRPGGRNCCWRAFLAESEPTALRAAHPLPRRPEP